MENNPITVSDAIALVNQTMEYAYPVLVIEGEVASFKVNKDKYVFFDIKDASGTLGCFMMVYALRVPVEDGMHVQIVATPKLTQWGKFSLTVRDIRPVGQGSIKRSFELLRAKLETEGLFDETRKRSLPALPERIGVISSTGAAGYIDFVTILNGRWGGMDVQVANVQVQGADAPRQIIRALDYFNQLSQPPEVIVLVRGGGSADDLSVFNDEPLVRALAASRVPTLVGVGHEVDVTLADLVADVRAATPSNAAQLLVPDRTEVQRQLRASVRAMLLLMERRVTGVRQLVDGSEQRLLRKLETMISQAHRSVAQLRLVLKQLDPRQALQRGYALVRLADGGIVRGDTALKPHNKLTIELSRVILDVGVEHVRQKD